jgi:chemotaxis protein MotB
MMGRRSKQAEPDEASGAPEWMVTFSDCMTLLLTFFVLLLSFSSFDDKIFMQLKVIFSKSMPRIGNPDEKVDKDAFLPARQIMPTAELDAGSEKPTLVEGMKERLKQETEPVDFRRWKVFLISSNRVFWGKGAVISSEGRNIMTTMASFLKEVPGRVVISENGPQRLPVEDKSGDSKYFGLPRAWAVVEYLTTTQNLNKKWFSISAASTMPQESSGSDEPDERTVEIVLLERSVYN